MIFTSEVSVLDCQQGRRAEQYGMSCADHLWFLWFDSIFKAEVGSIGLQKSNEEIPCMQWTMLYSQSVQTCLKY